MEIAPTVGQVVYVPVKVAEVHQADSQVVEYHTAHVRLRDGQQLMTHWSNFLSQDELVDALLPAVLQARPDLAPEGDLEDSATSIATSGLQPATSEILPSADSIATTTADAQPVEQVAETPTDASAPPSTPDEAQEAAPTPDGQPVDQPDVAATPAPSETAPSEVAPPAA